MAYIYGRIRGLPFEEINYVALCFKSKILYEVVLFNMATYHQSIIHQRESCNYLTGLIISTISGKIPMINTLSDFIMKEIVQLLHTT